MSNLQVCAWQESTSLGSRAVLLPQVGDSFSASAVVVSDDVSWQQGKTIPLCQADSYFLRIKAICMSCCGIHLSLAYSLFELTGMYVAECS